MSNFSAGDFIQNIFNGNEVFVMVSDEDSRFVEAFESTGKYCPLVDTSSYTKVDLGNVYLAIDTSGYQGFFTEKKILELHNPEEKDIHKLMYVHVNGSELDSYPHIHIYTKLPKTKTERLQSGACLSLIENAYFNHGKHQEYLTKDQFNALVAVLTLKGASAPDAKKNGKFRSITWWKYMLMEWNTENPKFVPYDTSTTKMPNYDYDTLVRWKERGK